MNAPNSQNQTKAIQKVDPRQQKVVNLRDYLEVRKKSLADVLPKHLTPDRVIKVALTAFGKTPRLQECSIESVAQCVMQAAELGLDPGGTLGEAYLVPFKGTCTLIPGFKGLIRLARQTGELDSIEARVVYENDKFDLKFGLDQHLEHIPNLDEPGDLRFVYAIARMKDGGHQLEVMTKSQIDKIRSGSQGANGKAWSEHYDEMARKTVIRRICKFLPLSPEKSEKLVRAMEIDDDSYNGNTVDVMASAKEKSASRTEALMDKVKAKEADIVDAQVEPPPPSDEPNADEVAKLEQELSKK